MIAATILRLLTGSGGLSDSLVRAYQARLEAETDSDKLAAETEIARAEAAVSMARIAAADRWGAVSLGRYLIVLPFGIWWAAIWSVQWLNPWLGWDLVVVAVPPEIMDMAKFLVPAILLADGASLTARRFKT